MRVADSRTRRITAPHAPPVTYCSIRIAIAAERDAEPEEVGDEIGAEELLGLDDQADEAEDETDPARDERAALDAVQHVIRTQEIAATVARDADHQCPLVRGAPDAFLLRRRHRPSAAETVAGRVGRRHRRRRLGVDRGPALTSSCGRSSGTSVLRVLGELQRTGCRRRMAQRSSGDRLRA